MQKLTVFGFICCLLACRAEAWANEFALNNIKHYAIERHWNGNPQIIVLAEDWEISDKVSLKARTLVEIYENNSLKKFTLVKDWQVPKWISN